MRPHIFLLPPEPKYPHKYRQSSSDQTRIIHRRCIHWHREWEAENYNKDYDIQTCHTIDSEPGKAFHPKLAGDDVGSPA
jgi:hypothetical protein